MIDAPLSSLSSALAAFYCVCLALFALWKNPHAKANRLFAAYNISNAFWNSGDLFQLTANPLDWEWALRITGVGACTILPFVVHFMYELTGLIKEKGPRIQVYCFYIGGIVFAALHQTPLLHTTAIRTSHLEVTYWSQQGVLFPLFGFFFVVGMASVIVPLWRAYRQVDGIRKKQISYIFFAIFVGLLGLLAYFISIYIEVFTWIYYPLQVAVGFIFGFAIFEHQLIKVTVVLRRMALVLGIYVLIFLMLVPISVHFFRAGPVKP